MNRIRSRKIALRSLFVVALMFTTIAGFYTIENWRWNRAWDDYVRTRKAAGVWYEGDDPLPPEDENYAAIPLLRPLIGPGPRSTNSTIFVSEQKTDVPVFQLWRTNDNPNMVRPFSGDRAWIRPVNLTALQTYYRGGTNFPPDTIHERSFQQYLEQLAAGKAGAGIEFPAGEHAQSAAQDVLLALSRYDDWLRQLTEALDRPQAVFQTSTDPYRIGLRHLAMLKGVIHIVRIRAVAHLANEDAAAGLDDILTGYRITRKFTDDPLLISFLVRAACTEINHQGVWEGTRQRSWNENQLQTLQAELESIDLFRHLSLCLRGERTLEAKILRQAAADRKSMEHVGRIPNDPDHERRFNRFMTWAPAGWIASSSLEIGLMFDQVDQAVEVDRSIPGFAAVVTRFAAWDRNSISRKYLAAVRWSHFDRHWSRVCRTQANVNLAITACALERHYLKHGRYPQRLAELIPEFLKELPIDHVDGKPVRYRLTSDGRYRIYSLGLNQIDDGGVIAPKGSLFDESVWAYSLEEQDWKQPR